MAGGLIATEIKSKERTGSTEIPWKNPALMIQTIQVYDQKDISHPMLILISLCSDQKKEDESWKNNWAHVSEQSFI